MIDDRNLGPPKKVSRSGTPLPAGDTTTSVPTPLTKKNQEAALDSKLRGRPGGCEPSRRCCRRMIGRPADVWREGFAYGFRDALRLAAREIPNPDVGRCSPGWLTTTSLRRVTRDQS